MADPWLMNPFLVQDSSNCRCRTLRIIPKKTITCDGLRYAPPILRAYWRGLTFPALGFAAGFLFLPGGLGLGRFCGSRGFRFLRSGFFGAFRRCWGLLRLFCERLFHSGSGLHFRFRCGRFRSSQPPWGAAGTFCTAFGSALTTAGHGCGLGNRHGGRYRTCNGTSGFLGLGLCLRRLHFLRGDLHLCGLLFGNRCRLRFRRRFRRFQFLCGFRLFSLGDALGLPLRAAFRLPPPSASAAPHGPRKDALHRHRRGIGVFPRGPGIHL